MVDGPGPASGTRRLTRRRTLERAASGALATGLLAAGPGGRVAAASPQARGGAVQVVFMPNNQGVGWNRTTLALYQDFVDSTFNASTPGIRAVVYPGGPGNVQAQVIASAAGSGYADIYEGCCNDISTLQTGGWILPLDPYLKQDNVSTSLWSPGHVAALTTGNSLFGLPSYDGPGVIAYRQDILDALGLAYPDPSWTAAEAAALWQSCTTKVSGQKVQGVAVIFDEASTTWQYWLKGWGGEVMNAAHDRCTADSAAGVAALGYLAGLATAGVMQSGSGVSSLASGSLAFSMCGGWQVVDMATQLGTKYKWDILPVPTWPAGKATFGNIDFYALSSVTRHVAEAWQVLQWLTAEPAWQRFQMKSTLVEPCLLSLWDEWQATVVAAAPPLRGKALQWYKDAALGYAYGTLHFAYAPLQAAAIADAALDGIFAGKVTPQVGLGQIQTQVNALEAVAAQEQAAGTALQKRFPTTGPAIAAVPNGI